MNDHSVDHFAFVGGDSGKTHDFYTRVMRMSFVGAHEGVEPDGRRFFMLAFDAGTFMLEFEEIEGRLPVPPQAPLFPHFGVNVGDRESYDEWKRHLEQCRVQYHEIGENDCYLTDPNGLSIQLSHTPTPKEPDGGRAERGLKMLDAWVRAHGSA